MKTKQVLIPLMGVAMVGMAADPPATNSPATTTELSAAKDSTAATTQPAAQTIADRQHAQKVGERIALSGAITKAPPSKARTVGQLFKPFAHVKPQPQTRWLERTAWSTAASTTAGGSTPVEMRHEATFGLSIASR